MKKYNYKYFIGLVFGICLFGGSVFAAIKYSANIIFYENSSSTLNSNNVQGAIDELASKYAMLSSCPSDKLCFPIKSTLALGDYVSYTPSKTSYTTDTSKTGYSSTQTINPSELNLWRVISINGNGTVTLISENLSSTNITFTQKTGYKNIVGYLNLLASQYETSGITVGSRHFGYNGQTEYITSDTYFTVTAPWKCSTGENCSPDPDNYEAYGGGDSNLYLTDFNLVRNVLGSVSAKKTNGYTSRYWMSSRYYYYEDTYTHIWRVYIIDSNTTFVMGDIWWRKNGSSSMSGVGLSYPIRPIVILASGLTYRGTGIKEYPMEIITN